MPGAKHLGDLRQALDRRRPVLGSAAAGLRGDAASGGMCAEVTVVEITAVEMDGQTVLMQDPRVTAAARWT
jgi:hypothetical protein